MHSYWTEKEAYYCFVVTAYDSEGFESGFSNEVCVLNGQQVALNSAQDSVGGAGAVEGVLFHFPALEMAVAGIAGVSCRLFVEFIELIGVLGFIGLPLTATRVARCELFVAC